MKNVSGSIEIMHYQFDHVDLQSISGEMFLSIDPENIEVKSTSGGVNVENSRGKNFIV